MLLTLRSALSMAAVSLCLLSGCMPAPVETAPTAPAPLEPLLTDADLSLPAPEFLNEPQQDLYRHAFRAAEFFIGCSTSAIEDCPLPDGSTVVWSTQHPHETWEQGDVTYLISMGRYQRWEDFQSMLDRLFTPECQRELLQPGEDSPANFAATEDGRLCFREIDRGSDLEYNWSDSPDSFVLVEQTEDQIDFNLVGHYAILDYGTTEDAVPVVVGEYTREYPIRLEYTDGGWRVAEIHLPY